MKDFKKLSVFLFANILSCNTQNELELNSLSNEAIFTIVDNQPSFAGGMPAFLEYTKTNLVQPSDPKLADVQGKVFVQFVITKNGSIENPIILKGLEESYDKAALDLIRNSPDWIPGSQKGVPVNVRMMMPITFGMETKTEIEIERLSGSFSFNQEVDKIPEYEGGMKAFYTYVLANLQYPQEARRKGIEGKVMVRFTITKEGEITESNVLKGIGGGCDNAALRIIKGSPKWTPGQYEGKPVDVQMVVPISFKLD